MSDPAVKFNGTLYGQTKQQTFLNNDARRRRKRTANTGYNGNVNSNAHGKNSNSSNSTANNIANGTQASLDASLDAALDAVLDAVLDASSLTKAGIGVIPLLYGSGSTIDQLEDSSDDPQNNTIGARGRVLISYGVADHQSRVRVTLHLQ